MSGLPAAHDPSIFYSALKQSEGCRSFLEIPLGTVQEYPLLLFHPKTRDPQKPDILVASGFHGDEPAGPSGILYAFQNCADRISGANVSFLPIVNPTGFLHRSHDNYLGQNPNRGFCHQQQTGQSLTAEGSLLLQNEELIRSLSKHGFLSLHEDIDMSEFYFFTFPGKRQSSLNRRLFHALSRYFQPCQEPEIDGSPVNKAVIEDVHDGSCEDWLYHQGCELATSTETPGKLDFNTRVLANAEVIVSYTRFIIDSVAL